MPTSQVMYGHTRTVQTCPFCGMPQELIIKGYVFTDSVKQDTLAQVPDQGYSFCNCKNIFFTEWENMRQSNYNDDYSSKYNAKEIISAVSEYAKTYIPMFIETKSKIFTEIGAANNIILDEAKANGWTTIGVDINACSKIKDDHLFICGDVEDDSVIDKIPVSDVFWASHVFEHFHYPLEVAKKLYSKTNNGGYLFIAMPDPWFIKFDEPQKWAHWALREHHILWDMDSFVDEMIKIGYKYLMNRRNPFRFFCRGDYQLLFKK